MASSAALRPVAYPITFTARIDPELRPLSLTPLRARAPPPRTGCAAPSPPSSRLLPALRSVSLRFPSSPSPRSGPRSRGWLDRACRRPGCDLTVSELRELCEREQGMLFVMVGGEGRPVAAGVTQVRDHASGRRSCWILAVGGTRARDWLSTLEGIETGAAAISCSSVEFVGRPGWARLLDGYATEPCEAGLHFSKSLGAHS